jgi:hypothetical protein
VNVYFSSFVSHQSQKLLIPCELEYEFECRGFGEEGEELPGIGKELNY